MRSMRTSTSVLSLVITSVLLAATEMSYAQFASLADESFRYDMAVSKEAPPRLRATEPVVSAEVWLVGAVTGEERQNLPDWVPKGHVSATELKHFNEELASRAPAHQGEVTYDPDITFGGLTAAELDDLVFLAYDLKLTVEEAANRGTYAGSIARLAAEWEFRPGYTGWGFQGETPYLTWKSPILDDVLTDLEYLPYPEVRIHESNFGLTQLEAASNKLLADLTGVVPRGTTIFTDMDPSSGTIAVTTSSPFVNGKVARTHTSPSFEVTYSVSSDIKYDGAGVAHERQKSLGSDPSASVALRGGANFSGCTSGFILISATTSMKRVGTAGHCATHGTSRIYRNHPADGTQAATLPSPITYWWDGWDWGHFASGGNGTLQTFYYDYEDKRYVEGVGSPGYGQLLSVFGYTTKARKSAIVSVFSRSCALDGGRTHALTVMDRRKTTGGDSGGPWFSGNDAYGVHSGVCLDTNTNSFTRVSIFPVQGWKVWIR